MAWTATLLKGQKAHGRLIFEIKYTDTDTGESVVKRYNQEAFSKEQIKRLARQEVQRLASLKAEVFDFPENVEIDLTPPAVNNPPPTQDELDRIQFFDDWRKMGAYLRLVEAGLMQSDDTKITNLRATLQTNWKAEYLNGI